MNKYIGIDLGTSAVKLLLVGADGAVLAEQSESYPVLYPRSGFSEQNPDDRFDAVIKGLTALLSGRKDLADIKGISFGGQMHGLVVLDRNGNVIRPCILWNDGRSQKETDYLNGTIGREKLSAYTGNIAFPGFIAPKILWLKRNEPQSYDRIDKIMLPKDYIAYRLSGARSTDFSDASGTLLLDVKNRRWSAEMLELCGVQKEWLPELYESYAAVGELLPEFRERFGLGAVRIIAGAGDNAAAAVGTGTTDDSACNISLGTSGTVFIACDNFLTDKRNALHSFCHADGGYHLMGCILSAASCNAWWMNVLDSADYAEEQKDLERYTGKNGVLFLPYLTGERSPHNDVNVRGAFVGLDAQTTRGQMTLAVLEGVAFALRDCLEVAKACGINIQSSKICGGGARSPLWKKIIANVLNLKIISPATEQGPGYGAAILAMVGCGEYASVKSAAASIVKDVETIHPDGAVFAAYESRYRRYIALYPALKGTFR
jgi:xylulokinase